MRQSTPHSKSAATVKSRAKTNPNHDGTNPAAIFSDAGTSSVRPSSYRATPGGAKSTGRSGRVAGSGTGRLATHKAAVARQRSPWRPTHVSPMPRSSDPEVDRAAGRRRCPSLSPEAKQRRPTDRTRASSTTRVRRTCSVQETTTTVASGSDPPQMLPVEEPSHLGCGKSPGETQPATSLARSPRLITPARSTKPAKTTSNNKPRARDVIAEALKSAWEEVSKVASPSILREFLPVLAALLFVIVAVIGACVYTYMCDTPAPSPQEVLPLQPLQPSQQKPASPPNSIWAWAN